MCCLKTNAHRQSITSTENKTIDPVLKTLYFPNRASANHPQSRVNTSNAIYVTEYIICDIFGLDNNSFD